MEFSHDFYNQTVEIYNKNVEIYKDSIKRKKDEDLENFYNSDFFQEILKIIQEESLKGQNKICIAYFLNKSDLKNKILTFDILKKMGFEVAYSMEKSSGVFGYFTVSWGEDKQDD